MRSPINHSNDGFAITADDIDPVITSIQVSAVITISVLYLVNSTLPALIESLSRNLEFTSEMQGSFGSADYLGTMFGSLSAIAVMRYASPRRIVVAALLLLLATDFGSIIMRWHAGLTALRMLGGFGTGLGAGACAYVIGLKDPERMSGAAQLALNGVSLLAIGAMPFLTHSFGWRGIFLCLAVFTIPSLILSRHFPTTYKLVTAPTQSPSQTPPPRRLLQWAGLAGTALSGFGISSFWSFLGNVGAAAGLTERAIANCLSVAIIGACLGALSAMALGERMRLKTFLAALLLAVAGIGLSGSSVPWVFAGAISAFNIGVTVYGAAIFGVMMRRTPTEQFAVHLGGAQMTASVVGPMVSGLLVERWGFGALRGVCISTLLLCGLSYYIYFYVAYSRVVKNIPEVIYPRSTR